MSKADRGTFPPFVKGGTPSCGSCLILETAPKLHPGASGYTASGDENEFLLAQALWLSPLL